jgi:hypothetical protein
MEHHSTIVKYIKIRYNLVGYTKTIWKELIYYYYYYYYYYYLLPAIW